MTGSRGRLRAFIAIPISAQAQGALGSAIDRLVVQVPGGVRWVPTEAIHLTLKFLGDVEPTMVNHIAAALARVASEESPFQLRLSGLGMFPGAGRPRVLWAGLGADLEALQTLHARIEAEMSALGFPAEKRPFSPHLTFGRVRPEASVGLRNRLSAAMRAASLEPTEPWQVERVHLMRSDLAPGGAIYSVLASVALGGAVEPDLSG